jgi:hypothetical protein
LYCRKETTFQDILSIPSSGLIKTRIIPDYWFECLYCERSGSDWTTAVHKISQWGKAWWSLVRRAGQWEVELVVTQKSYKVSFFVEEALGHVNLLLFQQIN